MTVIHGTPGIFLFVIPPFSAEDNSYASFIYVQIRNYEGGINFFKEKGRKISLFLTKRSETQKGMYPQQ